MEPVIPLDTSAYRPAGAPLARTLAKLKAGKPITIVTMGDSLTDFSHWTNHDTNWPTDLKTLLKQKHGSDVTLDNPAMGGTELRQNLVVLPRWTTRTPAPGPGDDLLRLQRLGRRDARDGLHRRPAGCH